MNCPKCNSQQMSVVDSRPYLGGQYIKRRRKCKDCGRWWYTVEIPLRLFEERFQEEAEEKDLQNY